MYLLVSRLKATTDDSVLCSFWVLVVSCLYHFSSHSLSLLSSSTFYKRRSILTG